jgi:hypothetical protein
VSTATVPSVEVTVLGGVVAARATGWCEVSAGFGGVCAAAGDPADAVCVACAVSVVGVASVVGVVSVARGVGAAIAAIANTVATKK